MEPNPDNQTKVAVCYKLEATLAQDLVAYLNSRPYSETNGILTALFENVSQDPTYTEAGVQVLVTYLQERGERRLTKPLIDRMAGGELKKFRIDPEPSLVPAEPVPTPALGAGTQNASE